MKKNILLLKGGGSTEHDISLVSAAFIKDNIDTNLYNVLEVEITKDFKWLLNSKENSEVQLDFNRDLITSSETFPIHAVIPCIHGHPGETGDIQSFFELINLPYLGCGPEASSISFNKVSTKLWFDKFDIPNTPYLVCSDAHESSLNKVLDFFEKHKNIFIKASNQGSSVGCYQITQKDQIKENLEEAFNYSPYVLIEKTIKGRELEVAVFEYDNKIYATHPGEINCPDGFYSYEEKYSKDSKTSTKVVAENLTQEQINQLINISTQCFDKLKLRHLSRIDFFLTDNNEIYLNEINTFPGMTPISMFPQMMQNHGIVFRDYLNKLLKEIIL